MLKQLILSCKDCESDADAEDARDNTGPQGPK